jgi:putative glutathione S-transferase
MGRLLDGEWVPDPEDEFADGDGFDGWVAPPDADHARFPAEAGRYHLYISRACPWAHRTALMRRLKGLEDVVSLDVVDPVREDDGWEFSPGKEGCTPDTVNGSDYLREVYTAADPDYSGRVTVPVLWDREEGTIVNNESEEVMRMLDTAFDDLAGREITLYPEGKHKEVDETIAAVYATNKGVYRAGFAEDQAAYERAVEDLFAELDRWESVLSEQRYLCGEVLTEADVCLFVTLFRFDPVYHTHFKCNVRRIADYPNLRNYLREIAQLPGVAETLNMEHVKAHYYRSHADINPTRFVPVGPDQDLTAPHDRDRLPGGPPEALLQAATP